MAITDKQSTAQEFVLDTALGRVPFTSNYNKFGSNSEIDTGSAPEDIWGGSGLYTGFDATAGEAIEVLSDSGNDSGTLVSSGTATGGSATTLVDAGADFVSDGVSIGDIILNDTQKFTGIVSAVATTTLTVLRFCDNVPFETYSFVNADSYRVATTASTGAAVVEISKALESDYDGYKIEYIIMNGTTPVDTTGTDYIRNSRARVLLSGSNGGAVGVINGRQTTTTANVFWEIDAGDDQTLAALDTIPKGHTLYVRDLFCGMARDNGSPGSADVDFKVRNIGSNTFNVKVHDYISSSRDYKSGTSFILGIPEYSDILWRCNSVSDNNTQISAEINGYLIENDQ